MLDASLALKLLYEWQHKRPMLREPEAIVVRQQTRPRGRQALAFVIGAEGIVSPDDKGKPWVVHFKTVLGPKLGA